MNSNSIKNSYCENMNAILDFFDILMTGPFLPYDSITALVTSLSDRRDSDRGGSVIF